MKGSEGFKYYFNLLGNVTVFFCIFKQNYNALLFFKYTKNEKACALKFNAFMEIPSSLSPSLSVDNLMKHHLCHRWVKMMRVIS